MRTKTWRSVAIGVMALALVAGALSFGPARAAARQLLSVFRVRKFAVVQISSTQDQTEAIAQALEDLLGDQEPQVLVDEPVQPVATIEEASELAGFPVRMPGYLPGEEATRIEVKGRTEIALPVQRESLALLFEMAGMDASLVPADFSEGQVLAMAPAMVAIMRDRLTVVQVPDATVEYPQGLDPSSIGKAGLIVLGFSPEDAERITDRIDWSNTLLVPVPAEMMSVQETEVAGSEALLLRPTDGQSDAVLMWQKDDVLCLVSGKASADRLMQVAASMYP